MSSTRCGIGNGQPKAFNVKRSDNRWWWFCKLGGTNRNKVYEWTGVSWEIGGTRNSKHWWWRSGGVYDGVVLVEKKPQHQ